MREATRAQPESRVTLGFPSARRSDAEGSEWRSPAAPTPTQYEPAEKPSEESLFWNTCWSAAACTSTAGSAGESDAAVPPLAQAAARQRATIGFDMLAGQDNPAGRAGQSSSEPLTDRSPGSGVPARAIAKTNLPRGGFPRPFWTVPPDLAVEVVSPSNTRAEIREKVLEYLDAGSRLVWVVEPRDHSVTTYLSRTDVGVLKGDDALDGFDVLPGFRLRVADVFTPPEFPPG